MAMTTGSRSPGVRSSDVLTDRTVADGQTAVLCVSEAPVVPLPPTPRSAATSSGTTGPTARRGREDDATSPRPRRAANHPDADAESNS
jgi:hypothetical protein